MKSISDQEKHELIREMGIRVLQKAEDIRKGNPKMTHFTVTLRHGNDRFFPWLNEPELTLAL